MFAPDRSVITLSSTVPLSPAGTWRFSTPSTVPETACPCTTADTFAPRSCVSRSASDGLLVMSTWKLLRVRATGSWDG